MSQTYASRTKITPIKSFTHPTAEQAIIFDHQEGLQTRDYMLAIYQLIDGAQNIIAASRVSGNRVIMYLSNADIVNTFQEKHGGFYHKGIFIRTRKLRTPAKKIVLSNVSPEIPNSEIEKYIVNQFHLKLASPVSLLRALPKDDLFSHVISWRRQFYIQAETNPTSLPNFFSLNYADHTYRIYVNSDELTCFKCGTSGHKAEDCPNIIDDIVEVPENNVAFQAAPASDSSVLINSAPIKDFPELTPSKPENSPASSPLPPLTQNKRGPSTLVSESTEFDGSTHKYAA